MNKRRASIPCVAPVVAVFLLLTGPAYGQATGVTGGFLMGINTLRMGGFTSHLERQGYPVVPATFVALGGAVHGFLDPVVLGVEGCGFSGNGVSNDRYEMLLSAAYGLPQVGVVVFARRNLYVYPLAGAGIGTCRFKVIDNDALKVREYTNSSFLTDVALALEYLFSPETEQQNNIGVVFGLRFGYMFSSGTAAWRAEGNGTYVPSRPFPRLGMAGPYLRLYLAGGWIRSDADEPEF